MTSFPRTACAASILIAASGLTTYAANSVNVYLSAPFTETAGSSGLPTSDGTATGTPDAGNAPNTLGVAGVATETFTNTAQSYTTLNSPALSTNTTTGATNPTSAVFTSASPGFTIKANNQYGGGGQGSYLGIPSGTSTTLTLNANVGYLGLMWNAVDAGNSLTLYDQNNAVIGTLNASTFAQILPTNGTITALNGNKYNTADYYGQPTGTTTTTGRLDNTEQFAYLNFVAQGTTKISKIVVTEAANTAIFEGDNYSILTATPTVDSTHNATLVPVTTVPEPSTWALILATGGLMMLTIVRRRRCA